MNVCLCKLSDPTDFWGLVTSYLLWMAEETSSAALKWSLPPGISTASIVLDFCIRLEDEIADVFQQFSETENSPFSEVLFLGVPSTSFLFPLHLNFSLFVPWHRLYKRQVQE